MSLRNWTALVAAAVLFFAAGRTDADVYSDITTEALRANNDAVGRPLPLASHWTTGIHPLAVGWAPNWQLSQITLGHHLIPWFQLPDPINGIGYDFTAYAQAAIQQVCSRGLPLVLVATQWEFLLYLDPYKSLPSDQNPNVVQTSGALLQPITISPFGPTSQWAAAGRTWTTTSYMQQLQQWCPNPTLVIFLSNNEAPTLNYSQAESDYRYVNLYGTGQSDQFKRQVVGDAWVPRYRALQAGMRAGLTSPIWRANAKFVGYSAFGPPHLGRWSGWAAYSLYRPDVIDPAPMSWDGGSPSYYVMNSTPITDFLSWSPQNEFQNLVFMQDEALAINPSFWFEISVWDGYVPGGDALKNSNASDNRAYYASLGQTYTPDRYKGYVQFGMWLNRPRAVREFRDWIQPRDANTEPYFLALVDAVDSVYRNPRLMAYWRNGRLLSDPNYSHPYQNAIPPEYASKPRWFILAADANGFTPPGISPNYPADLTTGIRVFSLALELGTTPTRTWLVYATSPLQDRANVGISIPGYSGSVTLATVAAHGNFYEVFENSGQVQSITP